MLLQFTVENVLSFRDETVLSLLAVPGVEHAPGQVIEVPGIGPVLRVVALYGANASGKSNLVKALQMAAALVLVGTLPGRPIRVSPFKLAPDAWRQPSRFEFEIWADGFRWSYGFACTAARVEAEWLYRDAGDGENNVFLRSTGDGDDVSVEIGDALRFDVDRRQFWKFVAEGTRPEQLFLAEASQRNVKELAPLLRFFWGLWGFVLTAPNVFAKRDDVTSFAAELLRGAGAGVAGLEVVLPRNEAEDLDSVESLAGLHARRTENAKPKIRFLHETRGVTEDVFFEEEEESDGTRRLVELAPNWFLLEKTDATIVIDELDRSLHSLLSRNLLERFLASDSASSGQLIFTTHDTNLLDLELLPQDSIRFVEKDLGGGSSIYSLAEFKAEQLEQLGNKIESGYLLGRFGGTPFLRNPRIAATTKKNAS
ncbi:AAA family ATPase [Paraliomyxa miuraensis]|uniref:AAA family ATPase n=1 Tax=Paraliomyxa miuraensis TaxID=376150 RepID=UPI00224E2AA0|nr:AAA family ATPase [Paraliomyxa miuraensis]MCX4240272.1 AAA family ATPase [Paraliomyxa miuraensis]